jgi:chaperonin GroEL (HSP60 family)
MKGTTRIFNRFSVSFALRANRVVWKAMLGLLVVLSSSYGPHGRSKVLKGATGVTIITKDCQQIIEQLSDPLDEPSPWDDFFLKSIKKYSRRHGDGGMTLLILLSALLQQDQQIIEAINSSSSILYRSHTLTSISILIETIHSFKELIIDTFIQLSLWKRIAVSAQLIEMISLHLLVPASNPAIASNLTHILVIVCSRIASHPN